ncbi:hypothetical protein [Archangium sp.]|jgi:hypothetical protein|uniref:hypothetical protein n=1 Tax=Archangium sp. TaxID=1872627 RepID=UPI002ED79D8E
MFRSVVAALLIPLLAAPVTHAQAASSKTESKPAETQPADAPVQQAEEPPMDMDFDLLESSTAAEAPVAVDPKLEKAIARRRTMLSIHQGLGIAMAVTLAATVVVGQLNFDDRYRGYGDTGKYRNWHTGLVVGSSSLFAGTGLLGLLAPTPFEKKLRWDTITFHKIFMSLATAGMLSQVLLGRLTEAREGKLSQVDTVRAHQVLGYATLGAVTAGALMIVF